MPSHTCCVYLGDKLAAYGFGNDHPFGPQRHAVFEEALRSQSLDTRVDILPPVITGRETLELFHNTDYIDKVIELSQSGQGFLDNGDTPAFEGMYEAARHVAGSVEDAIEQLMNGNYKHAFVSIAGLHHARRDTAAGFCVINDCGIAIEIGDRGSGEGILAYAW